MLSLIALFNIIIYFKLSVMLNSVACVVCRWYHGAVGRLEAEELLAHQQEGSFLVRQSESNRLDFSLSLK